MVCASTGKSAADPATDLCVKDGAKIEVEPAPNGSRQEFCVFPSGTRVTAWAYFRNNHRLH